MPRPTPVLLLIALAVALASCSEDGGQALAPPTGPVVPGVPGLVAADADLDGLARSLARALAEPGVRGALRSTLARSRVREGKLHLQRVLTGKEVRLAAEWAAAVGESPDALLAQVGSLSDLEIYLPDPGHRTRWRGGKDVLVLAAPEQDEDLVRRSAVLRAWDTRGQPVLLSALRPPGQPVIVLGSVEQEGVFGPNGDGAPALGFIPPSPEDTASVPTWDGCGGLWPGHRYILVCRVHIDDVGQYEPWLRGQPEVSMRVGRINRWTGEIVDNLGCLSQDDPGTHSYYDQNADGWQGHAVLTTDAAVKDAMASDIIPTVLVWEDDSGAKCDFAPELGSRNTLDLTMRASGLVFLAGLMGEVHPVLAAVSGVVHFVALQIWSNADDLIGVIGEPPGGTTGSAPKKILRYHGGSGWHHVGTVTFETRP